MGIPPRIFEFSLNQADLDIESGTDRRGRALGPTKKLLHSQSMTLADRFAGLLILLFGQRASKIVTLIINDLNQSDETVTLRLGDNPLELPAPMDAIAIQLAANRSKYVQLARVEDQPWLFPGGHPGQPLPASRMSARMNVIGIRIRPSRQTTLMDLATQLPHPVLSQLLGIGATTASRWSAYAGSSSGNYAAHLTQRASSNPNCPTPPL